MVPITIFPPSLSLSLSGGVTKSSTHFLRKTKVIWYWLINAVGNEELVDLPLPWTDGDDSAKTGPGGGSHTFFVMDLQLVSSLRCSSSNRQTSPRQNGGKWTLDRNCDFCETQDRNSGDFQFWNKWNNWKCTWQFFYINTQKFFSGKSSLGKFPMMKVWEMTTAVPEQRETFWPLSAANNNSCKAFTKTQQRPLLRVCIKVAVKEEGGKNIIKMTRKVNPLTSF